MKSNLLLLVITIVFVTIAVTSSNGKAILKRESDKCRQGMQAGRCFGYIPSFAYDAITGKCKEFIYGGCGGNENRFDTIRECEKTCRGI